MKKSRLEQNINKEKRDAPIGQGVIFVKTRKSDDRIWNMTEALVAFAEATDVEVVDVIVDETCGCDIDRDEIDRLCEWIENSPVGIIFLLSLEDITRDLDDLEKFLERAAKYGMIIVDMSSHAVLLPNFDERESEC